MPRTSEGINRHNLLTKVKYSFRKGGFASHVTTMLAGNISAQAVAFIAAPFITRIYSPDDFGSMTLVWSYIGVFSVIACLRYESPIVIEKETDKAYNIFLLCIIIAACFSLILAGVIFLSGKQIADIIGLRGNDYLLWFIPVGVFAFGLNQAMTYWHTRLKNFFVLSFCRVSLALITAGTKIALGLLLFSSGFWLLTGNVLGLLGSGLILGGLFLKGDFSRLRSCAARKDIVNVARKYSKFPRYHSITGLMNSLSQNFPVMLFAFYFSPQVVGFYGLANSILRKPIGLMGDSLSKVFLQKAAHSQAQGHSLRMDWVKTTQGLAIIGILPFGILMVWGSYIFSMLFGKEWATSGLYAQLLAPWLFMLFINPPSTQILIVKQKLKFNLYFNVVNSFLRILVIIITVYIYSRPTVTIAFFSGVGVLANLYYLRFAYQQADKQ